MCVSEIHDSDDKSTNIADVLKRGMASLGHKNLVIQMCPLILEAENNMLNGQRLFNTISSSFNKNGWNAN